MPLDLPLDDGPIRAALTELHAGFDHELGGFGLGAKQPAWPSLGLLLGIYGRRGDRNALHMACVTLRRMALGGINDQIGGGFWRASQDRWWMIPEFSKPLYDNARLLDLNTSAWLATGDEFFGRISLQTARWMINDLPDPDTGLFARAQGDCTKASDRDHYLWRPETVRALLDDDEHALIARRFGLDDEPNLGQEWHLHVYASLSELARQLRRPRTELLGLMERANARLLAARRQRPTPSLDHGRDLRANASAVAALARAGRLLEAPELVTTAARVWQTMDPDPATDASPPTLAHWLSAGLELLRSRWDVESYRRLERIAGRLLREPHAPPAAPNDETRSQATEQDAAIRITALNEWGTLSVNADCLDAAERTLRAWWPRIEAEPLSHPCLLQALDSHLHAPLLVLIQGEDAERARWQYHAERPFNPNLQCQTIPIDAGVELGRAGRRTDNRVTATQAWLCRGARCLAVIDSLGALRDTLAVR
jgi:uncharacterized protein